MSGDIPGGLKGALYLTGLKAAQDTERAVLSVVSASLENIKQITAKASAPTAAGVGGKIDISV